MFTAKFLCLGSLGLSALVRVAVAMAGLAHLSRVPPEAHPVSQGKLEIAVSPDRVSVRATVSNEEVLVAAATVGRGGASALEIRRAHGDYLLGHFHVTADGAALAGKVVARPETLSGRPDYVMEFELAPPRPARLVLREDVLREFEFAPGVPWEASYIVQIRQGEQAPSGVSLLTRREPLEFACDWSSDPPDPAATPSPEGYRTALTFFRHGVMHILTGYDHLLFVAALLLAARSLWDLVKVVTAFSLAHTLTLVVSALDVFRIPVYVVEPMIAASIVFVAVQNILWPNRSRGASRLLMAFLFGLFHGLGLAADCSTPCPAWTSRISRGRSPPSAPASSSGTKPSSCRPSACCIYFGGTRRQGQLRQTRRAWRLRRHLAHRRGLLLARNLKQDMQLK